ncbi:hypothetical protein JMA_09920 [Jeotgalibacillus malaysiensis]|uniref:DUF3953 domain-containing protein n=1 Tax=Jeotgalibacillus malaysiensis TaxID=1508404 RepID=A0A0B5AQH1_9BACL|nr:hypothetical protein JMA_09920 [Jeotgalibacillus malaysiensis]
MKKLRFIFIFLTISLAAYGILNNQVSLISPYVLLTAGGAIILSGLSEFQKRSPNALSLFFSAGFMIIVSMYILISI